VVTVQFVGGTADGVTEDLIDSGKPRPPAILRRLKDVSQFIAARATDTPLTCGWEDYRLDKGQTSAPWVYQLR
jgi:hypothetical protein